MKAADFEGCVNVMTGKSNQQTQPTETKITVDLDKVRNTGNLCPSNHGYIGGGYCKEVDCAYASGGHDWRLGGKGWGCRGGAVLRFTGAPIRATTDERFPFTEPELGRLGSMQNGLSESEIEAGIWVARRPAATGIGFGIEWKKGDLSGDEIKSTIASITPGSPADKAGLIEDDIIKSVNGIDVKELVGTNAEPGKAYIFLIERDSDLFEVKMAAQEFTQPEGLVKIKDGEVIEVLK